MVYCCVPKCFSRSDRNGYTDIDGSKITFHAFPKDEKINIAWRLAVRRRGENSKELWVPKSHSVVCSRHFLVTDFKRGRKYRCLLSEAIPSVFTDDLRIFPKSKDKQTKTISTESQNLPAGNVKEITKDRDQALISEEMEIDQASLPVDPKLVQVWSCSEIGNGTDPTNAVNNGTDNLPLFMKQALIEKEKIDLTYEGTNSSDTNILMKNGNLQSDQSELEKELHMNIPNNNIVKIELDLSNAEGSNSAYSNVPYSETLDPVTQTIASTNSNHVFPMGTPSLVPQNTTRILLTNGPLKVKTRNASTNTRKSNLEKILEVRNKSIVGYRRRISNLEQKNRRLRRNIMHMKHAVFCQLQNRNYLSNKSNFNVEKQGCLLDRNSVKVCQSSETEESEED